MFAHREHAPAPGYRHPHLGTLYSVGRYGFCWSSSILAGSSNVRSLNFLYDEIGPNSNNYRSYGLPLRCLQE